MNKKSEARIAVSLLFKIDSTTYRYNSIKGEILQDKNNDSPKEQYKALFDEKRKMSLCFLG